jgi:hypothetical protein
MQASNSEIRRHFHHSKSLSSSVDNAVLKPTADVKLVRPACPLCAMCGRLRLAREIFTSRCGSVQPCVRPVGAAHMTAGHNASADQVPVKSPRRITTGPTMSACSDCPFRPTVLHPCHIVRDRQSAGVILRLVERRARSRLGAGWSAGADLYNDVSSIPSRYRLPTNLRRSANA